MNIKNLSFYLKETLVSTSYDITPEHIKAVERNIRNSFEYKKYLGEKRNCLNQNNCAYLKDFDFSNNKAKLELHHHIHLYDLVEVAYKYLIANNIKGITTFDVANIVMEWHYRDLIPYVFLSKTMHELHHSGQYQYELNDIKGTPLELYNLIKEYLTPELDIKFKEVIQCQKN